MERDSWIDVLVRHVDPESKPGQTRQRSDSRKSSKDVVITAAQPLTKLAAGGDSKFAGAPSPSLINSMEVQRQQGVPHSTSTPVLSTLSTPTLTEQRPPPTQPLTLVTTPSSDILSTSPPTEQTPRLGKRQSMMPPKHQSHSAAYLSKLSAEGLSAPPGYQEKERDRKAKSGRFWPSFGKAPDKIARPVFAVPLTDSIAVASVANLPAIVFRCIEWLEAKKAEQEEGIYRLSGSSAVIKGLKDRFDAEGDVNLVQVDEHWDPHAIAGLLKTFLRELPTSLLTRELHPRFLAVMG
jgi:RalA-binding protein 1